MVEVSGMLERFFQCKLQQRNTRNLSFAFVDQGTCLAGPVEVAITGHEIQKNPRVGWREDSIECIDRFLIAPGRKENHGIKGIVGLWRQRIETKGLFDPFNTLICATEIGQEFALNDQRSRVIGIEGEESVYVKRRLDEPTLL